MQLLQWELRVLNTLKEVNSSSQTSRVPNTVQNIYSWAQCIKFRGDPEPNCNKAHVLDTGVCCGPL